MIWFSDTLLLLYILIYLETELRKCCFFFETHMAFFMRTPGMAVVGLDETDNLPT